MWSLRSLPEAWAQGRDPPTHTHTPTLALLGRWTDGEGALAGRGAGARAGDGRLLSPGGRIPLELAGVCGTPSFVPPACPVCVSVCTCVRLCVPLRVCAPRPRLLGSSRRSAKGVSGKDGQ